MTQPSLSRCPKCGGNLKRVPSHAYLNDEQWDSVKAGDWFCDKCPDAKTRTGYTYFWNHDLAQPSLSQEADKL